MPRLPIVPTIIVGLAAALMVTLGIWQLDRLAWKQALIARYSANLDKPVIAFSRAVEDEALLYRRATATCGPPIAWQRRGGRSAAGTSGYRLIAECGTGSGDAAAKLLVDMGVTGDPTYQPEWPGGVVTGTIVSTPGDSPAILSLFGGGEPASRPMLVAEAPAPGLEPSARPDPRDMPNNHLAYAVQWFVFAGIAVVIYLLALRRRRRPGAAPRTR